MEKVYDKQIIEELFELLNQNKIEYMLIKNINNELPNNLQLGKDIDLLIKSEDLTRTLEMFINHGYEQIIHPQSQETGWILFYGAENSIKLRSKRNLLVDIHTSLVVKSTMCNGWIPLDKKINVGAWESKEWDEDLNCWRLNEKIAYVYEIARSVFDKGTFTNEYIKELNNKMLFATDDECDFLLRLIFYRYTDKLKELLLEEKYDEIIDTYFSFHDYQY